MNPGMPTETIIRRATPDDLPTLGRFGALLVRTHHAFDPKRFIDAPPHTEAGYASYLGEQLGEPNAAVLVAVHDDRVIGYAYAGLEGRARCTTLSSTRRIGVAALDGSCSTPRWRFSRRAARHVSCSRRPSRTRQRNVCSRARAFAAR